MKDEKESVRRSGTSEAASQSSENKNKPSAAHGIARAYTLLLQLGLCVMVPLFLGVGAGIWLDRRFGGCWTLILAVVGLAAGARSAFVLAKGTVGRDELPDEEYDLMADWEEITDTEDIPEQKDGEV